MKLSMLKGDGLVYLLRLIAETFRNHALWKLWWF